MKTQNPILILCTLFCTTSCVNSIEYEIEKGTVPITFTSHISKPVSRITETTFEKGDKLGLFAMITPTDINGKRYIDNLLLTSNGKSQLIAEEETFYPADNTATLDFISYHPYSASGVFQNKSSIQVSVLSDQSSASNYSTSQFLVAKKNRVASKTQSVNLEYEEQFAKICIELQPAEGETIEAMYAAQPRIIANGFCTEATYDFITGAFSDIKTPDSLIPHGEWKQGEDKLYGKEFIIIPQETGGQSFTLEWNGKLYTCPFGNETLQGRQKYTFSISANQHMDYTLVGVVSSIKDWEFGKEINSSNQYGVQSIQLAALSFSMSDVYHIYHNDNAVAEICKEYLTGDLNSCAIVVYPVEDGRSNLQAGKVLQLLDNNGVAHSGGGDLSWDVSGSSFSYTSTTPRIIKEIHIDNQGNISFDKIESPANVYVGSYRIRDIRDGEQTFYPVVKIGTQYWMKEDLSATAYQNGIELSLRSRLDEGAGYLTGKNGEIFYNGEALLGGELAPKGWKIPNLSEWEQLNRYIGENIALVKTGTWKGFTETGIIGESTNETGLSIQPTGLFAVKTEGATHCHMNTGSTAGFWISGETAGTLPEEAIIILGNKDMLTKQSNKVKDQEFYYGLSIRCIKE